MKSILSELAPKILSIFKHLHEHPEVSWLEVYTTNYISRLLQQEGFEPKRFKQCTGVYVDIGHGSPVVGLRADMDALWQEVDGVWQANHSCGHDGHMTMAIGSLLLLKQLPQIVDGTIRVIFQPAEEKGGGALKLLEEGVIDPLSYLFSVHVRPIQELNDGDYSPALYHGAAKTFIGEIVGEDAHAARPHLGQNAIEIGAAIVQSLTTIHHDPMIPASFKLTRFQAGGEASNIIPGRAEFTIDVRAQCNEVMDMIEQQIIHHIEVIGRLHGVKVHVTEVSSIVAAEVDEHAQEILSQAIIDVVGEEHLQPAIHTPGGEDFHYYAVKRPRLKATMLGLGCGLSPGLHHPNMTFNEQRLITGIEILTRTVLSALQHAKNEEVEHYVRISNSERVKFN
ncbi:M20 peptidase aminoacylase family protein [Solibacillus sp. FSL H8-0538]|uniref:M20 peptidase aminoacylase family protein n=1 Tax=Solibacillus sp. FSL H8-0538 TaxID=2921400 RepID=UPI0030F728EF